VLNSDLPIHPYTGLQALGFTKNGTPIYPVMGGSQPHGDPSGNPDPNPNPDPDPQPDPAPQPDPQPDRGFPEGTAVKDMTPEQQANYWKFHDRRKSDTLKAYDGITPEQAKKWKADADEARRRGLAPDERALEDAKTAAKSEASREAAEQWAPVLAQQVVERFLPGEDNKAQRESLLDLIDPMKFMTDGSFDTDGLVSKLSTLAPGLGAGGGAGNGRQPSQWGQGNGRPPSVKQSDEGLAEARRRGYIPEK
jgi:hypothetical protein